MHRVVRRGGRHGQDFGQCRFTHEISGLDIAQSDGRVERISNTEEAVTKCLRTLPEGARVAIEATGQYHEMLLGLTVKRGLEVYIVNGKQLHHYREAVGPRAKTDTQDAQLLRRYLCQEYRHLTPVKALNEREKRLWWLLKRRATFRRNQDRGESEQRSANKKVNNAAACSGISHL